MHAFSISVALACALLVMAGCGGGSTPAIGEGIGAMCETTDDCADGLDCLTEFADGYCGRAGCEADDGCPEGSICVVEATDNYCFLTCLEKPDCNEQRPLESEANCSSNIDRTDGGNEKACVPPSSGT